MKQVNLPRFFALKTRSFHGAKMPLKKVWF